MPVELGYARHVYKAQGVTVDTADLAVSLRTHLNELYVMISRAREGARIHALAAENHPEIGWAVLVVAGVAATAMVLAEFAAMLESELQLDHH